MKVLDANNSYYYTEYQNHHRLMLEWEINGATGHNKMNIEYGYIRFPLRLVSKNLYYTRMGRHDVSEREVFFEPEALLHRREFGKVGAECRHKIGDSRFGQEG